jgi:hypothetical protein
MLRAIVSAWVLAAAAFAAQTVDGHVVNAATGADIPGVAVMFRHTGDNAGALYRATTDSRGRFRIEGVPDGIYIATYKGRGFWTPHRPEDDTQPHYQVSAAGGPIHLDAKMLPIPTMSGRVLDALRNPVANASVWMLQQTRPCSMPSCFSVSKELKTGAKGEFSFADFEEPGAWVLSATAPSSLNPPDPLEHQRLGWAQTFYPNVADPQLAATVMVQPGIELPNVDIKLAAVPVHRVRGSVIDVGSDPVPKVPVTLYNGYGTSVQQQTGSDGVFEFGSVADGEWRLSARLDQDKFRVWGAQSVRIKDQDLEKVELRITPPVAIHGRMVFKAPDDAPRREGDLPNVILSSSAGDFGDDKTSPAFPMGRPDKKGEFTVGLYPGPHHVYILEPPPAQYYLDSVRLGDLDAMAADGVSILSGDQPLIVTYQFGGGTVHGTIEACGGGRVMLLPLDPALRRYEFVRDTPCSSNGQFQFAAVRPGEYYGVGIPAGTSAVSVPALLGTDKLSREARRISVRANESTTADIRLLK